MEANIKLKLSEINNRLLRLWRAQFGEDTVLDIQISTPKTENLLREEAFWSIIDLIDLENVTTNPMEQAIETLSSWSVEKIEAFEDQLAQKLFFLDTEPHARMVYPFPKRISVDGFLYIRAAVLAQGKSTYYAVLADPQQLESNKDFEPLLSLAAAAYERKTGRSFEYISAYSYETYANQEAWT